MPEGIAIAARRAAALAAMHPAPRPPPNRRRAARRPRTGARSAARRRGEDLRLISGCMGLFAGIDRGVGVADGIGARVAIASGDGGQVCRMRKRRGTRRGFSARRRRQGSGVLHECSDFVCGIDAPSRKTVKLPEQNGNICT